MINLTSNTIRTSTILKHNIEYLICLLLLRNIVPYGIHIKSWRLVENFTKTKLFRIGPWYNYGSFKVDNNGWLYHVYTHHLLHDVGIVLYSHPTIYSYLNHTCLITLFISESFNFPFCARICFVLLFIILGSVNAVGLENEGNIDFACPWSISLRYSIQFGTFFFAQIYFSQPLVV